MQEKLLILRTRHHYSKKYVAEYLGLTAQQYAKKEKGHVAFNSDEMFLLADLFGKKLDDIFLPRGHQNGDIAN